MKKEMIVVNYRSIYKLIDFGAARELNDEEHFLSLCGTPEYLVWLNPKEVSGSY
jgi:serine/threonine protein kinase